VAPWNVADAADHLPSHCLSVLASFFGYYQVPRAAARRLVTDGGRQRCGCCFFRRDRRLTAPSANAAGAGLEVGTISRDAACSMCGAGGVPSTSAHCADSAGASGAGGDACWGVGGIGGGTSILAESTRGIDADAGW